MLNLSISIAIPIFVYDPVYWFTRLRNAIAFGRHLDIMSLKCYLPTAVATSLIVEPRANEIEITQSVPSESVS